MLYIN